MGEAGPRARVGDLARDHADDDGRVLLELAAQVWPEALRGREVAGLPGAAAELLFPRRVKRGGERAARSLDRLRPGWVEAGGRLIAAAPMFTSEVQRVCLLVGHRPLQDPAPLLRRLENSPDDPELRFWLLVALAGTDTAATRRAWTLALRRACERSVASRDARGVVRLRARTAWRLAHVAGFS